MRCPRCNRSIAADATAHSCGWHAGALGRATLPCAFDECTYPAFYNVERPEGRANVCATHYHTLAQQDAAAWCKERGIDTPEQAREYLRRMPPGRFGSGFGGALARLREPGDDDEGVVEAEFMP